jgi:hypothetical protein
MLEWIKKGEGDSGEPMQDPAAAAKALAAMCDADPLIALNDLRGWLETLAAAAAPDEQRRGEILALAQDAGQAHAATLLAQYLGRPVEGKRGREANWIALVDYLKALTEALAASATRLLAQAQADPARQHAGAVCAARALNAARNLAKVCLVRYHAVPPSLWRMAYTVHDRAEKAGCATTPVRVRAAQHLASNATQELLQLLMLQSGAPEMLAPAEIEVADRVAEHIGADFTLRPPRVLDNVFCFDPAGDRPPLRTDARPPGSAADVRCFGAGVGLDALQRLYQQLATARGREALPFGKDIPSYTQISAIQHLLGFWGATSPYTARAHAPANGELQVVHGFASVWRQVSSAAAGASELSLVEDEGGVPQAPEIWQLRDSGGNELGADVPKGAGEWARCGDVVGIRAPGEQVWWPGVIRSLHAEPGQALHVTLYVLSRAPKAVQFQARIEPGEEAVYTGEAARQFDFNSVRAIIVSEGGAGAQAANMLLAPDGWKAGRVYELASEGATRNLRGLKLLRRRDDYVRATFEWSAES